MTQERQPRNDYRNARRAGLLGAGAVLAAVSFWAGGTLGNKDATATNTYSPRPTATELATARPSQAPGTPRPSEAAGTPAPTEAPVAFESFSLQPGEQLAVQVGDVIAGDVAMADSEGGPIFPLYDTDTHKASDVEDNTKTALYVVIQKDGVLYAPYGGFVARGLTADRLQNWIELQKIEKQRSGFTKVDVVVFNGVDETVDQAGTRFDGTVTGSTGETPTEPTTPTPDNLTNLSTQEKLEVLIRFFVENDVDLNDPNSQELLKMFAECLCGCTVPQESPTPSVSPSTSPEACPAPAFNDHIMRPGETYRVPEGVDFIAQGDVLIDGKKTYDNNENTGAISIVTDQKANTVKAPWGADIQVFECPTDEFINETYQHDLDQLQGTNRTLDNNSINQLK